MDSSPAGGFSSDYRGRGKSKKVALDDNIEQDD
jgi:hypothetical protein